MAFDGTKETCPNRNTTFADASDRWNRWNTAQGEAGFDSSAFQEVCFEICGSGKYVESGECKDCPDDFYESADPSKINSEYENAAFVEMCDHRNKDIGEEGVPIWFQRQLDGNLSHSRMDKMNWDDNATQLWVDAQRPMTNEEIKRRLGKRTPGTMEFVLPDEFIINGTEDYDTLRNKINTGRGLKVLCNYAEHLKGWTINQVNDTLKCYDPNNESYDNDTGVFGPKHIVPDEVHDFWINEYGGIPEEDTDTISGAVQSFSELLSGLSVDSNFEACVNDKLNTGEDDYKMQEAIKKYTKISEFTPQDINYLKRKLKKINIIKTNEIGECMNLLNLGESICATGVADKTLQIGSLIFSIVGNNKIDVLNADNEDRMKLNKMIDELGPLIPQAIKNIIHVSKEYESRICNVPSNTTLLLERLYTDLYDKEVNVNLDISPYIDFHSLIGLGPWKFAKTICVILVFSFLFMQFANIVVAFLSRGETVTKIA